jgi:large subunit ribosomal protein L35
LSGDGSPPSPRGTAASCPSALRTAARPAQQKTKGETAAMPKNKTHSGSKKRFRLTGSGKVMRGQAGKRHYLEHKSSHYTRSKTGEVVLAPADVKKIKRLLGK